MIAIGDPANILDHPDPHSDALMRYHRLMDSLGSFLQAWTPADVVDHWGLVTGVPFMPSTVLLVFPS